ncbi:MAG: chromate transporter [Clostridiales bacterium]|jgi:chromate transporter|nr:chromate transporter [Clostridiales bacterium]
MNIYLDLFLTFAKIGTFTFGGGYAMLPMFQKELCERHDWATKEEILDYYAVAQCTPGVIAVNTATFVGAKQKGALGAACATIGVVFPAVIIITIIALVLKNFADIPAVQHAFNGIRVAVAVLILNAVIRLWKSNVKTVWARLIFAASLLLLLFVRLSPVYPILGAAAIGIVCELRGKKI